MSQRKKRRMISFTIAKSVLPISVSYILLFFIAIAGCGQDKANGLIGRWVSVRVELKNGETGEKYTYDGKPYPIGDTLVFVNDTQMYDSRANFTSFYKKSGNVLYLGDRKFLIEKFKLAELVLLENDDPLDTNPFRTYYSRVKK